MKLDRNDMRVGNSQQAALASDVQLLSTQIQNPLVAARILEIDLEKLQNQALLIMFMRSREFQWLERTPP